MSGYLKSHRKMLDNPLFKGRVDRLGAWVWLFHSACWKPTKFDIKGKTVMLERGQFVTSYRRLAKDFGWSKATTERFLTRLKTETMIETATGTGQIIITICNYDEYQLSAISTGTVTGTVTGTGAGQERDTKEEGKKSKKEESKDSRAFYDFWDVYPRRLGKKAAAAKFSAAVKSGASSQHLIDAAARYAVHVTENRIDERYVKHPTTWLNQGCWDDELKPEKNRNQADDRFTRKIEMARRRDERHEADSGMDDGEGGGDAVALLPAEHFG